MQESGYYLFYLLRIVIGIDNSQAVLWKKVWVLLSKPINNFFYNPVGLQMVNKSQRITVWSSSEVSRSIDMYEHTE